MDKYVYKFTIRKTKVLTRKELIFLSFLVAIGVVAIFNYFIWWFDYFHIAANQHRFLPFDIFLFLLLSVVIWPGLMQRLILWFITFSMRKPEYVPPENGLKVALLTCFVPGKEPYDLLEKTVRAMTEVSYPHDTWILDEGNDPWVKTICARYGAYHFSRFGIAKYNETSGQFKAKTKAGNHNAWRDLHENKYNFVAQIDMDYVPNKNYLDRALGYFKDEKVAFVVGPQIYVNTDNWIARGAAEQAYIFYGPIQQGLYGHDMPLFIGTNHVYRPKALQEVGGYASSIVEDHLTGMRMYAKGWKGIYIPEVIAKGEGPRNWIDYLNQQMRWSYGTFDILFHHTPKLLPKLSWPKKINYIALQTHYLRGVICVISIILTCIYLVFGYSSANIELFEWIYHALPPFLISYFIYYWSQRFYIDPKTESGHGFSGILLDLGALPILALSFFYVVIGKKLQYIVTTKGSSADQVKVPLKTFTPHLILIFLSLASLIASFFNHNDAFHLRFWAAFTVVVFSIVILSSRKIELPNLSFSYSRALRLSTAFAVIIIVAFNIFFYRPKITLTVDSYSFVDLIRAQSPKISTEQETPYLGALGDDVFGSLDEIERNTDKHFSIIGRYQSWGNSENKLDFYWLEEVKKRNAIPLITWEPWAIVNGFGESVQEAYRLKKIVDGEFDGYITLYAKDVKQWNKPIFIKFAHEMNGNWYPWSVGINNNTSSDYINAWRHVHTIFSNVGATNVTWVWAPNELYVDPNNAYANSLDAFYPGDEYVDWVGFSGFNWGASRKYATWRSFKEIVDPIYRVLKQYGKPIMIAEMNTTDIGGDKEEWYRQMNLELANYPMIKAVIWFESSNNNNKSFNFRLESSKDSYSSF